VSIINGVAGIIGHLLVFYRVPGSAGVPPSSTALSIHSLDSDPTTAQIECVHEIHLFLAGVISDALFQE